MYCAMKSCEKTYDCDLAPSFFASSIFFCRSCSRVGRFHLSLSFAMLFGGEDLDFCPVKSPFSTLAPCNKRTRLSDSNDIVRPRSPRWSDLMGGFGIVLSCFVTRLEETILLSSCLELFSTLLPLSSNFNDVFKGGAWEREPFLGASNPSGVLIVTLGPLLGCDGRLLSPFLSVVAVCSVLCFCLVPWIILDSSSTLPSKRSKFSLSPRSSPSLTSARFSRVTTLFWASIEKGGRLKGIAVCFVSSKVQCIFYLIINTCPFLFQ